MKKLIFLFAFVIAQADAIILDFDNIQSVQGLECKNGKMFAVVEIDDTVQPMQVFKLENGKQLPVACSKNKITKG